MTCAIGSISSAAISAQRSGRQFRPIARGIFMHAQLRPAVRPLATLGALLTVLASPGRAAAQQATGSFDRKLTVSGPVDLEVFSASGRIDVRTGQAGKIEVTARI